MNEKKLMSEKYQEKLTRFNCDLSRLDNILVQIETTNACNHSCNFCPNRSSIRKKTFIDYDFACRMIRESAEFPGDNKKICFHMNGEPFLYKRLADLIRYSKQQGFEYIFITTNGSLCTHEYLDDVFEAGLNSIKFSINAGKKEEYKKIHGKDDLDNAVDALRYSDNYRKENKKDIKIFVSCVVTKDNYKTINELKNKTEKYCDELVLYNPCGYAGQNNTLAKELRCPDKTGYDLFEIKHTVPCPVLWNSINITCEGFLSLCCSESDNRLIIEDLKKISLKEAWMGDKMNRIRKLHLEGRIDNMPCRSCVYETDYDEADMDRELFELALKKRTEINV